MPTLKSTITRIPEPPVGSLRTASATEKTRHSITDFLAPLEAIVGESPNLVANYDARFLHGPETYKIPRYIFVGPQGGDTPIHIGIFAGLHGDRLEGTHAVIQFIKMLEAKPELARGYCLSFYPICNPTGFEDGTYLSRSGKDLNREFWKKSSEPEIWLLQAELLSRSFQGIISLQTDDRNRGFYSCPSGVTLAKYLLKQGHPVENAEGVLSAPPKARLRPFEIYLRAPTDLSSYMNEITFIGSLQMVLAEYREFIAHAPNL